LFIGTALWLGANVALAAPALLTVAPQPVTVLGAAEAVVEAVRQATLAAQVPGRVVATPVEAGQKVKAGQLLLRLDVREAGEQAQAAAANLANAKSYFERSEKLRAQGFISAAGLDKARADYDAAKGAAGAAGAGASRGDITAPFAGVVAARPAELGDLATPGKPLLTVYDPSALRVTANWPQAELGKVRQAKKAWLEVQGRDELLPAGAITVLPAIDIASQTAVVRVALPAGSDLLPGTYAKLRVVLGEASKLAVPASAVVRRGEVTGVYVQPADEKSKPQLRQIRLGGAVLPQGGDGKTMWLEVLSGLTGGEKVWLEPARMTASADGAAR
jgi:RND family efflux transporter MFP subunit